MNDSPSAATPNSNDNQRPSSETYQQTDDLQTTQKLLRATLDSSMDMIQVFEAVRNEQGEIIDFIWLLNNHASEKIYGNVVGKSLLQQQPGVVKEGIFAAFKQVVETGEPQQYEKQYIHEQFDGWFHQSVVKLNDGVATTTSDITSRKLAEQQVQQSKSLLQDIIDAPNIGIAVYRAVRTEKGEIVDFVHEYINRASLDMLGGEDFTGKLFTDHGENGRLQLPQLIEVIQTGRRNEYTREADFRGQKVWFAITNTPLDSERLVHTWEDVTERKTAELELQEQAHFIRSVTDTASAIISITEFPSGATVFFNRDPYLKLGFDADELVQMKREDRLKLVHPDDMQTLRAYYIQFVSLSDTDEVRIEYRLKNRQGGWVWLDTRGKIFKRDGQGNVSQLLHIAQDITQKKNAEQEILQLKDEIAQRAEDKYRTLFNSIDEGFVIQELIYDEAGRPVDVRLEEANPAHEKLTGLKNVVGKTSTELGMATEAYWFEKYDYVLKTGEPLRFTNWHAPTRRWYDVFLSRLDGAGSTRMSMVFNDITQRKQNEQRQAFLLQLSDSLRPLMDAAVIRYTAVQVLGQYIGANRIAYAENVDGEMFDVKQNYVDGLPEVVGRYRYTDYGPDIVSMLQAGKNRVQPDIANDGTLTADEKEALAANGVGASLNVPLVKNGKLVAFIGINFNQAHEFTSDEIGLVEETAERTWAAVERAKVEQDLRQSEEKYRTLFESIDEGFCIFELLYDEKGAAVDWLYTEANPAFERQTGYLNPIGKRISEFQPDLERAWFERFADVARTGESVRFVDYTEAMGIWYDVYALRVGRAGDNRVSLLFTDITEHKKHEQGQTFLLNFSDQLRKQVTPNAVAKCALEGLIFHLRLDRSYIVSYDLTENIALLEYQIGNDTVPPLPQTFDLSDYPEAYKAIFDQTLVIEDDFEREGLSETEKQNSARLGMRAMVSATLRKGKNKPLWSMVAINSTPRRWRVDEIQLIEEVAERTWAAVERAKVEEQLRQSQQRFESIANLVPDLLWDSRPDSSTNWYNQRWLDYTGQRFEEAIDWGWTQAIHPDDREASARGYGQAVEAGQSLQQEHRIRRHDGTYRWFVVSASPVRDETGQVVKMYGAATDIHDRKLAETALQESEKRLRLTIEATELATWEWNLETNQVYWNEQHFRLFGMEPRPNPVSPDEFIRHVHPQEQARIKELLERTIAERGVYDAEFCAVREDGSQRWMSDYGRITEERDGQAIRLSGVMLDVDERRRAEDALRLADRRKDEFLAMLAHELRNPMSTIRSGLQILMLTSGEDAMTASTVTMMDRQMDHLVRMVDDLLDVSRISRGKIELRKERVNLVDLVRQAVESVQAQFEQQGKRLQVSLPTAAIELEGDATRLTQVVTNLLTNGLRYTGEQGQVWLRLKHKAGLSQPLQRTGGTADHSEAILEVRDNGIGLAEDQLTAIFELFVQVDNSLARSKGGLGLGLTLVKRLVEMHGGHVEAQSEGLGRGSTFTVHLPTLTVAEQPTKPIPMNTDTATTKRILVIDDNADAAFTLAMLLKLKGYEIHTRNSGRAGIEAAETLQPAAILLDIGMPDLDGYATCRRIRAQSWSQDLVIIALTGYGQDEDRQRTKEAGFNGHLVKPVDLSALLNLLTDLLDKGKSAYE